MMRLNQILLLIPALFLFSCQSKETNPDVKNSSSTKDSLPVSPLRDINPNSIPDVSPMDMIYFPVDYPKLKMTKAISEPPVMRVIYSRPHLGGRKLFVNLQKYDEYWRLGANEATEIQFYRPVFIQGKKINPGRYVLFCVPAKNEWSIYLNTNVDTWGLSQDTTKNLHRFSIPSAPGNPHAEYFTMLFEKSETGALLIMAWDEIVARLPIDFQ